MHHGLLLCVAFFTLHSSLFALTSCQAEGEYSTWPCRFTYDNGLHIDPTLASSNQGGDATHQQVTELERLTNYILGLNNGIIVGFQTFNTAPNGGFVAYDVQCPNCVRRENNTINPKYPVTMSTNGIATCGKCGKKYDLNNGGLCQNGEEGDVGLQKYLASTTGPNGFLSVGTKR